MFRSFWQTGFELASHINGLGACVDMLAATQHVEPADADYARLRTVGIQAARDGVRCPLVERQGQDEFSSVAPVMAATAPAGRDQPSLEPGPG